MYSYIVTFDARNSLDTLARVPGLIGVFAERTRSTIYCADYAAVIASLKTLDVYDSVSGGRTEDYLRYCWPMKVSATYRLLFARTLRKLATGGWMPISSRAAGGLFFLNELERLSLVVRGEFYVEGWPYLVPHWHITYRGIVLVEGNES